jgi:hypothetical protein
MWIMRQLQTYLLCIFALLKHREDKLRADIGAMFTKPL